MKIPFHRAQVYPAQTTALWSRALKNGWLTTGPITRELEEKLAAWLSAPSVLAVNSCTSALHIALVLAGVGPGDEVVLPSNTFIASLETIHYTGAKPVLCDIHPTEWNLNLDVLEKKITRRTRAVVAVPFAGMPLAMNRLRSLCRKRKLQLILDNAHALESSFRGEYLHNYADFSCYSFYATKNLTTAEGGALVCRRPSDRERARRLILHGMDRKAWGRYRAGGSWKYAIEEFGYKYNLSDIQSALGLPQIPHLDQHRRQRERILKWYRDGLRDLPGVSWQVPSFSDEFVHAHHLLPIHLPSPVVREKIMEDFRKQGIGFSVHFIPLYRLGAVRKKYGFHPSQFPENEKFFRGNLSLPLYPSLSRQQVAFLCDRMRRILD